MTLNPLSADESSLWIPLDGSFVVDHQTCGAKAFGIWTMATLGLPTPPAVVFTTDSFKTWLAANQQVTEGLRRGIHSALRKLEHDTSLRLGDPQTPLLVSVRSSPIISLPGILHTVLNVGMNASLVNTRGQEEHDASFAQDVYARFLTSFVSAAAALPQSIVETFRVDLKTRGSSYIGELNSRLANLAPGVVIPEDPAEQVSASFEALFRSWVGHQIEAPWQDALHYPESAMAVIVQAMAFGNRPLRSASGVAWTRDLETGSTPPTGTYLMESQGADVVGSFNRRQTNNLTNLERDFPAAYSELLAAARILELHERAAQEMEFVIDTDKLWLLQTRTAPLAAPAAIELAVELVDAGVQTQEQAVLSTRPDAPFAARSALFSPEGVLAAVNEGRLLATGIPASTGIAAGPVSTGHSVGESPTQESILVSDLLDPQIDFERMHQFKGFVTRRGGTGSHSATLLRKLGKPYAAGCTGLVVRPNESPIVFGPRMVDAGTLICVDGTTGNVFLGDIPRVVPPLLPSVTRFTEWYSRVRTQSHWEAANYPYQDDGHTGYRTKVASVVKNARWGSEKALITELLMLAPTDDRILQSVHPSDDVGEIRRAMLAGIEAGCWVGPKACHVEAPMLGQGPWETGICTAEQVERFLYDPEYVSASHSGGYQKWRDNKSLSELVVVYDPPGKGDPSLEERHFVFTVSCNRYPPSVQIEMKLGTSRLRSLEESASESLIHITMQPNYYAPKYQGPIDFKFGSKYWRLASSTGASQRTLKVAQQWAQVEALVQYVPLQVARQVATTVFGRWWGSPFDLPHFALAIDEAYGLDTLEFQGRFSGTGEVDFMRLFDAKGHEEALALRLRESEITH